MPLTALLVATALLAPTSTATDDFAAEWKRAEDAIRGRYYARVSRKSEMERYLGEAAAKARGAQSRAAFNEAMDAMIARFADSHFAFHTDQEQGYYMFDGLLRGDNSAPMPHVGAWFRPAARGGWEVRMVLDGEAAALAGLRRGDLVVTADGAPFAPIASLRGKTRVELGIRRDGQDLRRTLEVKNDPALALFLRASRQSGRVIEANGKRIGYFRLWTMGTDGFRQALASAVNGPLAETDAFILDLRDGFGGRPEGFADAFFRPAAQLEWGGEGGRWTQQFGYAKPLFVLINDGSRSAKEVLALILQSSGRAKLVGTRTAGAVLGTSPYRLNAWSFLEIPMVELKVNGRVLEDNGVVPDVEVAEGVLPDGRDRVLARALDLAGR